MKSRLRQLAAPFVVVMPWRLKRAVLQQFWGYDLHPTARIGWSYVFPEYLAMAEKAFIGPLNVAIHVDRITLGAHSIIGRSNWITGHPVDGPFFTARPERRPELHLGAHAAIVTSHTIDCSDRITIGDYTVVGGYRSQILTHGISLASGAQDCRPVEIGARCLIGTGVIILGGAVLPGRSSLGAGSVLRHAYKEEGVLYAGVPARNVRPLDPASGFFHRER